MRWMCECLWGCEVMDSWVVWGVMLYRICAPNATPHITRIHVRARRCSAEVVVVLVVLVVVVLVVVVVVVMVVVVLIVSVVVVWVVSMLVV